MKKITTILVLLLAGIASYGQAIVGSWEGSFTAPTPDGGEVELSIVFHIEAAEDGYTSSMDSPEQGQFGIGTDTTTYADKELIVKIGVADFVYTGKLIDEKNIKGSFVQYGMEFQVDLIKKE